MREVLAIFLLFLFWQPLSSQCTFIGPETIAPNSTRFFNLEVSGVVNDNLADPDQGVCLVLIDFEHPIVGDLLIKLISPDNDTVTLIGPIGVSGFTNRSRWNISFIPCGQNADPDPGFSPVWNNIQSWGQFGYFDGAYHPYQGCLEDFNSGSVNGLWQIQIQNNYPFDVPANSAILHDFTILFCDQDGLECDPCLAKGGTLNIATEQFCEGDPTLLLNIQKTFVGLLPDEDDYNYIYLISQNNTIVDTSSFPDLRTYEAGIYDICGLSYLIEDESELQAAFESFSPAQLRANLRSNVALFCGAVSNNCLTISIGNHSDTTFIQEYICEGDTVVFQGFPFYQTGIYTLLAENSEGCDSIIELNLFMVRFNATAIQPDSLTCINPSTDLFLTNISLNIPYDSITFSWFDDNLNFLSFNDTLIVSIPGLYTLIVDINYNGVSCQKVFEFDVYEGQSDFNPVVQYSMNVCEGSQIYIEVDTPIPGTYTWSIIQGNADFVSDQGFPFIILNVGSSPLIEFCLDFFDGCENHTQSCFIVNVVLEVVPTLMFEDSVCGFSEIILVAPGSLTHSIEFNDGPGAVVANNINDQEIEVIVDYPGKYVFVYKDQLPTCFFEFGFEQVYFPDPGFTAALGSEQICEGDSLVVLLDFLYPEYQYDFAYSFEVGGPVQIQTVDGGIVELKILPDPDQGSIFLMSSLNEFGRCMFVHAPLIYEYIIRPEIDSVLSIAVCNQSQTGESVFDFRTIFGFDITDVQIVGIENLANGSYPEYDFAGSGIGTFELDFSINYHQECELIMGSIIIVINDCLCPEFLLQNNLEVCEDEQIDLTNFVFDGVSGTWVLIENLSEEFIEIQDGRILDFNNSSSGIYVFQFKLDNPPSGCPDLDTLMIFVVPRFSTGDPNSDTIRICYESDLMLELFSFIEGYDPGGIWSYFGGDDFELEWLDTTLGLVNTIFLNPGIYHFQYSAPEGTTCSQSPVDLILKVEIKEFEDLFADVLLGCFTDTAVFKINLDTATYSVFWEVLDGEFIVTDPFATEVSIDKKGLFRISILNRSNGCLTKETFEVNQVENPIIGFDFIVEAPPCPGDLSGVIELLTVFGGVAPYKYQIDASAFTTLNVYDGLASGLYQISVMDSRGCVFRDSIEIPEAPQYFLSIGGDREVVAGEQSTFTFETDIPELLIGSLVWYVNGVPVCQECQELIHAFYSNSSIVLELITIQGCFLRDSLLVLVDDSPRIFVPQAFTPNGDGINDVLLLFSPDPNLRVIRWEIFDRWGASVFNASEFYPFDNPTGWDGMINNKMALPGEFVYYIEISRPEIETSIVKGSVLLAR